MANGRRKKHHAHELGDPYSEGWDAREVWDTDTPKPPNPYRPPGEEPLSLEAEQWESGWADREEDFAKGDLAEVTAADFKYVGVRRPRPRYEDDD